jgi:ribosomal protein S18 acetylase RimI-like enzyme
MKNSITINETLPDINDYWELFQTTGWNQEYNFSVQDLANAIQHSWYSVSLYDLNRLIGFGRVIADGIHHAIIVDLIIHPDYQGKGMGSKLLERLVSKCKDNKIRDIQLFAAKDKYAFYEKFGFEKRPINAPGMQLK